MKYFINIPRKKEIEKLKKSYIKMLKTGERYSDWEKKVTKWINSVERHELQEIRERLKLYVDINAETSGGGNLANEMALGVFMFLLSGSSALFMNIVFEGFDHIEIPLEEMSKIMGTMFEISMDVIAPVIIFFVVILIVWVIIVTTMDWRESRRRTINKSFYEKLIQRITEKVD